MFNFGKRKKGHISTESNLDPDEIFLDSKNLPGFDKDQFEGRIEKPINKRTIYSIGFIFGLIIFGFFFRVWNLQITNGQQFYDRSVKNSLRHTTIFAERGPIYDRFGTPLAWTESKSHDKDFGIRKYIEKDGFYNLLGYINYPKKDKAGFYFSEEIKGVAGLEFILNDSLKGENGSQIIETDALNNVISQNTTINQKDGKPINLTIDSDIQENLHNNLVKIIKDRGFKGGGAVIMDIVNGDIIALVTYPEYNSNILTDGSDNEKIAEFVNDKNNPFLNRVTQGLYTPGSIVKPFIAIGALNEDIIKSDDQILSTGKLEIPNPYDPQNPSIFTDWKAHGYVDMIKAIAVSSNIYFYEIGGGYKDIEGLGISRIEKYMNMFGFGESVDLQGIQNPSGTVPNPEWKRKIFDDDWRLGDTYFTSIGQYGFQVSPIQIVRAISAIANGGVLLEPKIIADSASPVKVKRQIDIDIKNFDIIRKAMRESVVSGTAKGLYYDDFSISAKTGTAELGVSKANVNSWVTGYFPSEEPKYAFVVVLEEGDRHNTIGGVAVMRGFFDWLKNNKTAYIK